MWFFSKMNVPEGVNTEAENLISRIPIRDLTFCDEFFFDFSWFFRKMSFLKIVNILEKGPLGSSELIFLDIRDPQNMKNINTFTLYII